MKYFVAALLFCYTTLGFSDLVKAKGVKEPFDLVVEVEEPQCSYLIYNLPIESSQGVTISQGPLNAEGSHGYLNCLYAIDFASSLPSDEPNISAPGKILAARDGKVIAVNTQGSSKLYYNCDPQGDGFGNWVAIQHELQEVSFYAHLDEVKVQVGEQVKQGQEIGIEGATGLAGFRHLHFSVHRLTGDPSENTPPYYISHYECIPYKLQYFNQIVDIRDISDHSQKLLPVSHYTHPLLSTLKEMYKEDQDACFDWIQAPDDKKREIEKAIAEMRREHNSLLKKIIKEYGWPTFEVIGTEGSEALWLLIQHQDEDLPFQKHCLKLLKEAVDQNQAHFKNYAYLLDRTRMNEQLPQIYGTQWVGEKGEIALYQVENVDELDKRRAKAGLPPMAEYKKLLQEAYHLTGDDFKK